MTTYNLSYLSCILIVFSFIYLPIHPISFLLLLPLSPHLFPLPPHTFQTDEFIVNIFNATVSTSLPYLNIHLFTNTPSLPPFTHSASFHKSVNINYLMHILWILDSIYHGLLSFYQGPTPIQIEVKGGGRCAWFR